MTKQLLLLLNSVFAKDRDLSVSLTDQLIDMLTTDKSKYFAHPRSIIIIDLGVSSNLICLLSQSKIIMHYSLSD